MSTVARYALVRFASACLTLFGVAVLIFGAIHALPGSFEDVLVPQAPQVLRDQIAARYGLDRPIVEQFGLWLGRAIQGDLGVSLITQQPVATEFARRLPVTVEVAGIATAIALLVGVPLGVLSGLTGHRRLVPAVSRLVGGLAMSVPDFVVGAVLLYVFSRYSLWFTVGTWVPLVDDPIANLRGALLPAFALSLLGIGLVMATARHATISVQERLGGRIEPIPGLPPILTGRAEGCTFEPRCRHRIDACALTRPESSDIGVRQVSCHRAQERQSAVRRLKRWSSCDRSMCTSPAVRSGPDGTSMRRAK